MALEKFKDYFTPNKDWGMDIVIGVIFGIMFIVLSQFTGLAMGFPLVPSATRGEQLMTVGLLAPFGEEIFFRGMLLPVLDMFLPVILSILIVAIIFSLFHATAYAGSFDLQGIQSVSGAFIGAGIFGIIFGSVMVWRKSIYPVIIMHLIYNVWIGISNLVVFA